ncbi:unnamed protein product, partial [Effrenium voratum]
MRLHSNDGMRPTYSSRAFVLGGDGVGQGALFELCQECSRSPWPQRSNQRVRGPGSLLLEDPLKRGPAIELTFIEVPYWWVEADLRRRVQDGSCRDCAVLVVDVCNPDSFQAALTRGKWALSAGLQCQMVLSFAGPCGRATSSERAVPQESLERLADEVSIVKPAHFDCTE